MLPKINSIDLSKTIQHDFSLIIKSSKKSLGAQKCTAVENQISAHVKFIYSIEEKIATNKRSYRDTYF